MDALRVHVPPPIGPDEPGRLRRLHSLGLLDTGPEAVLDSITETAAHATGMPMALISLVDRDRQWFKSAFGLAQGEQTPREVSFCGHAIASDRFFEVEDARQDARFAANPAVNGPPGVVHYAAVPLAMPEGERIGTLCVIGHAPGRLTPDKRTLLQDLARSTVNTLLLRESEMRMKRQEALSRAAEIADLSPVGLFSADAQGKVLQVNPGLLRLLGLAPRAPGMPSPDWLEAVHPTDRPDLVQDWQRAVAQGTGFEREFRTRPISGQSRWLRLRVTPSPAGAGRAAFVGAVSDITERHTSDTRLELALQAAELGLWELWPARGELYVPAAWARLAPGQPGILPLGRLRELIHPEDAARVRVALIDLLKGHRQQFAVEFRLVVGAGEPVWVESLGRVVERDEQGRALRVIGTTRDIGPRKRHEAALHQALADAQAASRAKADFLATMSHEIRTPLNGVIGITRMLRASELPPRETRYVSLLDSCANTLLKLVGNVLDLSKIEAGELRIDPMDTDLHALLRDLGSVFELSAREKQLDFELRIAPQVPRQVMVDPQRLRQVLLNLLANALKFTPRGRIGVHAGVEATSRHAQALLLTVWDTGNGISAADQERLFKRFSQVGAAGWQQSQGTGLGLSISRELARLMGGELTVRSEPGQGSSFQLELALVQPAAPARAFAPDGPPALPTGTRVLLVEDNAINQMVAEALLQRLGVAEVVTAADGAQALALCESDAFDLVLMDCQMPVMDGFEATRQLRARGCRWPIVALTAGGVTQDRDACLAAGMDDYLAKPIDDKLLGRVLQRWVGA